MTQSGGQMRQVYPREGEARQYRLDEREGYCDFVLEGDGPTDSDSRVSFSIESQDSGQGLCRTEPGQTHAFAWAWVGSDLNLWLDGNLFVFQRVEARRRGAEPVAEETGDVLAPMPGAVLEVLVSEGDQVERNQTVVIMESMKMELAITAPRNGIVRRVAANPGQQVERGMRLLELAPENDAESGD